MPGLILPLGSASATPGHIGVNPDGDLVVGGAVVGEGSGSGGTWSQPVGSPVDLDDEEEVIIDHPAVANERLIVAVWRNTAQAGQTWGELDFDFADEVDFVQQDAVNGTDFIAGELKLHNNGGEGGISTPIMTGPTSPSGEASASDFHFSYPPYMAFNRTVASETDAWTTLINVQYASPGTWQWLMYDFGSGIQKTLYSYKLIARNNPGQPYGPQTWVLQGDQNDNNWIDLEPERTKMSWVATEEVEYTLTDHSPYRRFRLLVKQGTNSGGVSVGDLQVAEMTLDYVTHTWYWVHTTDANRFSFTGVGVVNSVTPTYASPVGTQLTWLVSFDGRITWKKWNGTSWEVHAGGLTNVANGCSTAQVQAGLTAYTPQSGETGLDFAWGFHSTDFAESPSLNSISISYDEGERYDPCSIGSYGSMAEFGVRRISPTQTKVKNQTGTTQRVFAGVFQ
jgi:hypothetical protein